MEHSGSYVKQMATDYVVDSVAFAPAQYGIYTGATDYDVSGYITIGASQIPSSKLDVVLVLTNAAGQVVGADYDSPDNLPAVLTAGLRFKVDDEVPVTGVPAAAAAIYAAPDA